MPLQPIKPITSVSLGARFLAGSKANGWLSVPVKLAPASNLLESLINVLREGMVRTRDWFGETWGGFTGDTQWHHDVLRNTPP